MAQLTGYLFLIWRERIAEGQPIGQGTHALGPKRGDLLLHPRDQHSADVDGLVGDQSQYGPQRNQNQEHRQNEDERASKVSPPADPFTDLVLHWHQKESQNGGQKERDQEALDHPEEYD